MGEERHKDCPFMILFASCHTSWRLCVNSFDFIGVSIANGRLCQRFSAPVLFRFPAVKISLQTGNAIEEENPVEVIQFMLDGDRFKATGFNDAQLA